MTWTPSAEYAIETLWLTKQFRKTPVVTDLDLRIPKGSTFGFIGPNGAGKSTTIRMLMGKLRNSRVGARVGAWGSSGRGFVARALTNG